MITIGCILVLYKPNAELLEKVINAIFSQVTTIYVIDNSPEETLITILDSSKIRYVYLGKNMGIAYAQNVGLNLLRIEKIDFCFFLDQDSIVEEGMVRTLLDQYNEQKNKGINVGAIGPRPINRQDNKEFRYRIKKGEYSDKYITEVSEILSSASLIPMENFNKVGDMDASLFIDGVDHEWCWRCAEKISAKFFISEKTHLSHLLGEGDRRLLWKKVAIPTPFRTYYQFRNYFILSVRNYVPKYWKISNGLKYLVKFFYFPIFISPRIKYLKNMCCGIKEGIKTIIS